MEQQRVILVGLATGSVVARGALWTCAWSRVVDRTLSLGNGLLDPKMAKIHRCAGLQNKRLFIAKGKGAPRKADFFACLSTAVPDLSLCPSFYFQTDRHIDRERVASDV